MTLPQSCCVESDSLCRVAVFQFGNFIEKLHLLRIFCCRTSVFNTTSETFGVSRIPTLTSSLTICFKQDLKSRLALIDQFPCSNVLQAAEEKDKELKVQDKLTRTARVQPTPQTRDPDGPNAPSTDRRKYEPAQRILQQLFDSSGSSELTDVCSG